MKLHIFSLLFFPVLSLNIAASDLSLTETEGTDTVGVQEVAIPIGNRVPDELAPDVESVQVHAEGTKPDGVLEVNVDQISLQIDEVVSVSDAPQTLSERRRAMLRTTPTGSFGSVEEEGERAEPPFNVANYYDREAYISERVRKLILDEARFETRAKIYNVLGTGFMWLAGLSSGATVFISAFGASEHIDSRVANLATTCLGRLSAICMWTSAQLKKSATQYQQASRDIQVKLNVPSRLITHPVDIRIDPYRAGVSTDNASAPASQAASYTNVLSAARSRRAARR